MTAISTAAPSNIATSLPLPPESAATGCNATGGGASEIIVERGTTLTGGGVPGANDSTTPVADWRTPGTLRAGSGDINVAGALAAKGVGAETEGAGGGDALVSGVTSSATESIPSPGSAPAATTASGASAEVSNAGSSGSSVNAGVADAGVGETAGVVETAAATSPDVSDGSRGGARPI